jgi:GNAT superfamily N-acetyltransferase
VNIKIQTTNLAEARKDRKLMRVLYALTLRGDSAMRDELNSVCSEEYAAQYYIVLAKNKSRVVGWSIVFMPWLDRNYKAYFYVARRFRRKKVGTALYNMAKAYCVSNKRKMICSSWDEISASFFIKHKAEVG